MKRILTFVSFLMCGLALQAQPAGGFGGWQMPQIDVHCSEKFADLDYVGDDQVYHKLDIYLPKVEKESYPVAIHVYGSAWFSNNSKGMADLGTIVNALLDAGYAVVTPNHRSSMDAKFPAQIHRQTREGNHFHIGKVAAACLQHADPFFDRKAALFIRVMQNAHVHPVKQTGSAPDQIHVPVGHRIKAAGKQTGHFVHPS